MTDQTPHRDTTPFAMYQDGLEMFGRVVESSCKWTMDVLIAMEKAAKEASSDATERTEKATALTVNMIPETGDLQASAAAVEAAMSAASLRKFEKAAEMPTKSVRETVAEAKAGISAVKSN